MTPGHGALKTLGYNLIHARSKKQQNKPPGPILPLFSYFYIVPFALRGRLAYTCSLRVLVQS